MVQLGSIEADTVEELIVDFVGEPFGRRRRHRHVRPDRPAPVATAAAEAGRGADGGDQGHGEPQHVAAPVAYRPRGARELPAQRVPADRRGHPVAHPRRPRRPRARASCPTSSRSTWSTACSRWRTSRRRPSTISRRRCKSEFVTTRARRRRGATPTRAWRRCSTPSTGTPRRASCRRSTSSTATPPRRSAP